jgi:hypothetical protein
LLFTASLGGIMKILLISANRTEINMRTMPLGLAFVAQALSDRHHSVKMLDCVGLDDVGSHIKDAIDTFGPDVIGISIRNIDDQTMVNTQFLYQSDRDIIALVRRSSPRPIILGGAGYSMFPDAILADTEADMGEAALPLIIDRLEKGESLDGIPGLHVKGKPGAAAREFIRDAAKLPFPGPMHYHSAARYPKPDLP